jgi:hypothetical protein
MTRMLRNIHSVLIFLLIVFSFISVSSAAAEYEWVSAVDSRILYWGDSVTYNEYVIKADDFNENGYVHILIYKNGQLQNHAPLHVGGSVEVENEIRVFVEKVELGKYEGVKGWVYPIEPRVTVTIYKAEKKVPEIEIIIETDKDTYDPKKVSESTFTSKITIRNKGKEDLLNVVVSLNSDSMNLTQEKLVHRFSEIPKESNESIEITLETPLIWESDKFTIYANVTGVDPEGSRYFFTNENSVNIEQMWELKLTKSVSEILYLNQKAYCALIVRNSGLVPLESIQVYDFILEKIEDNTSGMPFSTTLSLKPGETIKIIEYPMIPDKPGNFLIPEAIAVYTSPDGKEHEISSGEQECEVVGPYIVMTKSTSNDKVITSEEITVTLNVSNVGNVDAHVIVDDQLPDSSVLVKGEPYFKGVIKKGASASLSYTIIVNEKGEIQLPAAKASAVDMKGYRHTFESNTPHLMLYEGEYELSKEKITIMASLSIVSVYAILIISSVKIMLRMARK